MKDKNISLIKRRKRETNVAAAVFLLPVFLFLLIFLFYPIVETFLTSLYEWNGIAADKIFIGLENWKNLIGDDGFWKAFRNNMIIMVVSIAVQLPIALALAAFLNFGGKRTNVFKVIWFIPMLMSSVAVGFLFNYALATNGGFISSISQLLGGGKVDLLGNPKTALFAVIAVVCWQCIPFYMIYFMASFSGISEDIFDAARIDGASRGQYFWKVAFPLIIPAISSAAILSIVGSLKYFDLVFVMTNGGPGNATELMATYMYKNSFTKFNMGYGSAVAGGMFIMITLMSLITMKLVKQKEEA